MSDYVFQLAPPARLKLQSHDGSKEVSVDVFEAWRMLGEAQGQPSEAKRWGVIQSWIAERLQVPVGLISESAAFEFNEVVIALGKKIREDISKKVVQIAS